MKTGKCHICGQSGSLSYEHVPPRKAFNSKPVFMKRFDDIYANEQNSNNKGKQFQKGAGNYTLCPKCNNDTGAFYAKHLVEWIYQAVLILESANYKSFIHAPYYIFPLEILKQIAAMFFSINNPEFSDCNPDLRKFVLDPKDRFLNPKYRFFVYFHLEGVSRRAGITGRINLGQRKTNLYSEIGFPPMGYVMTLECDPPDDRLFEISSFSRYPPNMVQQIFLRLPILPTLLWFPGDYRDLGRIDADRKQNEEDAKRNEIKCL